MRLLDLLLGRTEDAVDFGRLRIAENRLTVKTVILFIADIAELVIVPVDRTECVFQCTGLKCLVKPGLMDHLILFIERAADLRVECSALHAAAFGIKVAFREHIALLIQFTDPLMDARIVEDLFTVYAEVRLLQLLFGGAEHAADLRKLCIAQDRLTVGAVVLFEADIAELVIVAINGTVGILERAGLEIFVEPCLMDHLVLFIECTPDLGIERRTLHAVSFRVEVAFHQHIALVVQFTRPAVNAGVVEDRLAAYAKVRLLDLLLGCAEDAADFGRLRIAEDRLAVRAVILFKAHIAELVIVPVNSAVGVFQCTRLEILVKPGLMDHLVLFIERAADLGVERGALHAVAFGIKVAF